MYKLYHAFIGIFAIINWMPLRRLFTGRSYDLTDEQRSQLQDLFAKDNYIILTWRKTHLTSYFIGAMSWLRSGKWPSYAHALMNVDNSESPEGFKFMEATRPGVHWSTFEQVFNCDRVAVLMPAKMDPAQWSTVLQRMLKEEGTPYDDLFNLADAKQVSCVEMCRVALQAEPNYATDFANFELMISTINNLTPQLFRDCPDFKVVLELNP